MLLLDEYRDKPAGTILGAGVIRNIALMPIPTKWVACKSTEEDSWAIYLSQRMDEPVEFIMTNFNKVKLLEGNLIQHLIPCTPGVYEFYNH